MAVLCSVECLEGQFDTYGAFGHGFLGDLAKGGPTPIGAQKANLSPQYQPFAEEIALGEQVCKFADQIINQKWLSCETYKHKLSRLYFYKMVKDPDQIL